MIADFESHKTKAHSTVPRGEKKKGETAHKAKSGVFPANRGKNLFPHTHSRQQIALPLEIQGSGKRKILNEDLLGEKVTEDRKALPEAEDKEKASRAPATQRRWRWPVAKEVRQKCLLQGRAKETQTKKKKKRGKEIDVMARNIGRAAIKTVFNWPHRPLSRTKGEEPRERSWRIDVTEEKE